MAKKKFYAVAVGGKKNIYTDWATTEKQVKGVAGAKYKSFPTRQEAESWLQNPVYSKKPQTGPGRNGAVKKPQTSAGAKPKAAAGIPADAIVVYTDGGAINNPGPGGYGIVICDGTTRREISGGYRLTTNNRMEMTACIVALREVIGLGRPIVLFSDSSYLVNGVEKGWARSWRRRGWRKSDGAPALNPDLWSELLDLLEEGKVELRWVKGHAGNELNERCDQLAVAAARSTGLPADRAYEESR